MTSSTLCKRRLLTPLLLLSIFVWATASMAETKVDHSDFIYLLSKYTGDNLDVAIMADKKLTPQDRQTLLRHIDNMILLADEAERSGVALSPSVRKKLKWSRINILARAYVEELSAKWDLSDKKLRSYYKANSNRYVRPVRILARIEKCPDLVSARKALDGLWSDNTTKWLNEGNTPPVVSSVLFDGKSLGRKPPIRTFDGVYAVEVLKYEGQKVAPFEKVRGKVLRDLQDQYLAKDMEKLGLRR